jgi:hypothetical protein
MINTFFLHYAYVNLMLVKLCKVLKRFLTAAVFIGVEYTLDLGTFCVWYE